MAEHDASAVPERRCDRLTCEEEIVRLCGAPATDRRLVTLRRSRSTFTISSAFSSATHTQRHVSAPAMSGPAPLCIGVPRAEAATKASTVTSGAALLIRSLLLFNLGDAPPAGFVQPEGWLILNHHTELLSRP